VCAVAGAAVCALTYSQALHAQLQNGEAEKVLSRQISLSVSNARLTDVFTRLHREFGVPLAWSSDIVPGTQRVSVTLHDASVRGVLAAVLSGSGLEYVVTPLGTIVIVPQRPVPISPQATSGNRESPGPAVSASATGVPQLDAVVVMGSAVTRNPEREQPTAVSVVSATRLADPHNASVADVMRTMLPGVILWDRGPTGPPAPITAVRGVSSFTTRALKTYVDGIELASPELFTLVDVRSIERMEVIRGPQGAALYGPDALNGILQIETRHGRIGTPGAGVRAGVRASASGGSFARPDLERAEPSQDYSLGAYGSNGSGAFDVTGSFARVGRSDEVPLLKSWNFNAAGRALAGPLMLDASARIGHRDYAAERISLDATPTNPDARSARENEERAVAFTAVHTISDRWRQTLVVGHHRIIGVREAFRSPLLTPTLPLGATDETASRSSLRYSSVVDVSTALSLSAGAEYSRRIIERSARASADLLQLYRNDLHSTGAFVQGRYRAGARLVLSGGTRVEHPSSVASSVGGLWASTAGASWSHALSAATVRLRAAWGNGIRPPEPGMNQAMARGNLAQESNAALVPERQRGFETGVDLFLMHGAYVKATWYDQRAIDLIQQVRLRPTDTIVVTYQFQNVGAVSNTGIELEGGAEWRDLSATVIAHFPRSVVDRVGREYSGALRSGDHLLEVPDAAGSASLRYDRGRVHAELGASWVGSWVGYDWQAVAQADAGRAPRRTAERDYWRTYSAVARPWVAVAAELPRELRVFLRADNPANAAQVVRDNLAPPLGRTIMVGLTLHQ
jgi:iron complex outermembrane receptor protein